MNDDKPAQLDQEQYERIHNVSGILEESIKQLEPMLKEINEKIHAISDISKGLPDEIEDSFGERESIGDYKQTLFEMRSNMNDALTSFNAAYRNIRWMEGNFQEVGERLEPLAKYCGLQPPNPHTR